MQSIPAFTYKTNNVDEINMSTINSTNITIPTYVILTIILLSIIPSILCMLGFDFSTHYSYITNITKHSGNIKVFSKFTNNPLFPNLVFTIQTCTSFCITTLTAIIAFIHYSLTRRSFVPIVCMALFIEGATDIFFMLVINNVIAIKTTELINVITFSWTIIRFLNITLICLFHMLSMKFNNKNHFNINIFIVLIFVIIFYHVTNYCIYSDNIPSLQYPNAIVQKPFDLISLLFVLLCGFIVFPKVYSLYPNSFSYSLIFAMVPAAITQTHLTFGSYELFYCNFNIAFAVKNLIYLSIFTGLLVDYINVYNHQQKIKEAQEQEKQIAETINNAKNNFFSMINHEMRTPLNGILGMTQLLNTTKLDDEQQYMVKTVHKSGEILLNIINDVLDLSKLEANKFTLKLFPFSLEQVCQEVCNVLSVLAKEKGLQIILNYPKNAPESLMGDYVRIQQILINLVSNAIKFTDIGHIYINVLILEITDNCHFKINVKDTGIGIPKEDLQKLFAPFKQLNTASHTKYSGTGLGLTICKKIVEIMHGNIGVTSKPNEGSTFWLELSLPIVNT